MRVKECDGKVCRELEWKGFLTRERKLKMNDQNVLKHKETINKCVEFIINDFNENHYSIGEVQLLLSTIFMQVQSNVFQSVLIEASDKFSVEDCLNTNNQTLSIMRTGGLMALVDELGNIDKKTSA